MRKKSDFYALLGILLKAGVVCTWGRDKRWPPVILANASGNRSKCPRFKFSKAGKLKKIEVV
jgi:hypothetical protein